MANTRSFPPFSLKSLAFGYFSLTNFREQSQSKEGDFLQLSKNAFSCPLDHPPQLVKAAQAAIIKRPLQGNYEINILIVN